MGFCALNAMFWVSTAGFVGGMAMAPPAARADTAHGRYMAKKRAQVRVATASVHLSRSPRPADARVSASKRRGLSPSGIARTLVARLLRDTLRPPLVPLPPSRAPRALTPLPNTSSLDALFYPLGPPGCHRRGRGHQEEV